MAVTNEAVRPSQIGHYGHRLTTTAILLTDHERRIVLQFCKGIIKHSFQIVGSQIYTLPHFN